MSAHVLALDQGTTGSRAVLFDSAGNSVASAQYSLPQVCPRPGWVEQDPMKLLATIRRTMVDVFLKSGLETADVAAIGITNQRETTILWDRETGKPVGNAVGWQCRRTARYCEQMRRDGLGGEIYRKTGLPLDPCFSATKIKWLLDQEDCLRARAKRGELLFGTVDSWLIWNLTGGEVHCTDYANASRTMLFDIDRLCWDEDLCRMFDIPMAMLPEPVPSGRVFGQIANGKFAGVPICGSIGDQQAALFGQCCFQEGMAKNTYGIGCFTLMNTGEDSVRTDSGLITSVGWTLDGKTTYVLEGSAFNGGSAIRWLRDELELIQLDHDIDILAESIEHNKGVYFVPAFTGLGAPYWDDEARGCFFGLTRGTGRAELARAVLESIAFEVHDLVESMNKAAASPIVELRVDGGASASDFLMNLQAGLLGIPVNRPTHTASSTLGAAFLAGLTAGVWNGTKSLEGLRQTERIFPSRMQASHREALLKNWHDAVALSRRWGNRNEE